MRGANRRTCTHKLSAAALAKLWHMVRFRGVTATTKALHISPVTIDQLTSGVGVRRDTAERLERVLAEVEA